MSVSDDDLDLVETDRFVDALFRRTGPHGAVLLLLENDRGETSLLQCRYRGGLIRAFGLTEYARQKISADLRIDESTEISGD